MPEKNPATLMESIQAEVPSEASPLLEFLAARGRLIFFILLGLAALALAAGIWSWHASKRDKEGAEELGRLIIMPEGEAKLSALERFAAGVEAKERAPVLLALMQSASRQGLEDKAALIWGELASSTGGAFAFVAGLAEARGLAAQGRALEGIARLEAMLADVSAAASATASADEFIVINGMIADMAEAAGLRERAAAACAANMSRAGLDERKVWEQRQAYYQASGSAGGPQGAGTAPR